MIIAVVSPAGTFLVFAKVIQGTPADKVSTVAPEPLAGKVTSTLSYFVSSKSPATDALVKRLIKDLEKRRDAGTRLLVEAFLTAERIRAEEQQDAEGVMGTCLPTETVEFLTAQLEEYPLHSRFNLADPNEVILLGQDCL